MRQATDTCNVQYLSGDGSLVTVAVPAADRAQAVRKVERSTGRAVVSAKTRNPMSGGGSKRG